MRRCTILVVDDHDFQRQQVIRLLEGLGVGPVLEAASGRAGLSALAARSEPVDIVFCDLDMPGMDGVEFIGHLAESRLARAVAVVSAMEDSILNTAETMAKAYGLQVLGTIAKPIDRATLRRCVDAYRRTDPAGETPAEVTAFRAADFARALERHEFLAFFQPKVLFATGELCGVEALARWSHPELGLLAPYRFIGQIEAEGLAGSLTEAMLRQACELLVACRRAGLWMTASVNVAVTGLSDLRVADRLEDLVAEMSCHPRQIVFELTESAIVTPVAKALNVLARLRLKGFSLSIDDFGTGYSSLQQLSSGPFTELKIDRSFVSDSPTQPRSRSIIEASLDLARRLNLVTVAEGVETLAEWNLLKSMRCRQVQGHFVARPMPAQQVEPWMRAWQAPPNEAPIAPFERA